MAIAAMTTDAFCVRFAAHMIAGAAHRYACQDSFTRYVGRAAIVYWVAEVQEPRGPEAWAEENMADLTDS